MNYLLLFFSSLLSLQSALALSVNHQQELNRLFKKFDTDQDKKITVDDKIDPRMSFKLDSIPPLEIKGVYHLSNLSQELKLIELNQSSLKKENIFENPVDRITRTISERFWDGLTRRIDRSTLHAVIKDAKINSNKSYLYVPHGDKTAFEYYKQQKYKDVEVVRLPAEIKKGFITSLGEKQGLLSLDLKDGKGVPYVVPGGRFNEMYGWDSYFHVLGTIRDGRLDLAKGMVDNFIYEITHYGQILNANRTYYLTRSQPPFFTSMVKAVLEKMPKDKNQKSWTEKALVAALKEYHSVWMGPDRLTKTGLSRYAGFDNGIPPEVEPGHFNHILKPYAKKHKLTLGQLISRFNSGKIKDPELVDFFHQDRAVRESGHDTTYRWRVGQKDRASDFVTVDLNSLLYKYELDLAYLIDEYFDGAYKDYKASFYRDSANKRKKTIRKLLWNKEKGLFFDYNWKLGKQSEYVSATTFYPLWASTGYKDEFNLLSDKEARKLAAEGLKLLEEKGGLAATARVSLEKVKNRSEERQWDYPNGWAPHQILAWSGLNRYGLESQTRRLAYKWLYMLTINARDYNGTIPEKYDVVKRSHKVFAEYGNVGTKFSYITMEGFGWMNASYQLGLDNLTEKQLSSLRKLIPPEDMQF